MTSKAINPQPDPLLWSARKERARRWVGTDLRGYLALADDDETEETLAAEPKADERKKPKPGEAPA